MISAVVLTKNEEKSIRDCLVSLDWCSEIVIIDDYSVDKTLGIVEKLNNPKIKIYKRKLQNDFAAQRNYGLEKTQADWVLFVDADERISVSLQFEIVNTLSAALDNISGYYLRRRDILWGRSLKYGESASVKLLRLAKKNDGDWKGKVHERWDIKGKTGNLNNPLIHYPHPRITEFLQEINYYTDLRARELYMKGVTNSWLYVLIFPLTKFIRNYIFKLGFLDGIPGLIVAVLMSFHSFLVRGKLWQLQHIKRL